MTSESYPQFDPSEHSENHSGYDNPQNFYLPSSDKLLGLQLLSGVLRRNEFSNEEMFETLATVVTILHNEEFIAGKSIVNITPHSEEFYSQITIMERGREPSLGSADFERDIGLERTFGNELIDRNENAHFLLKTVESSGRIVSVYYDLNRDSDGYVRTYKTEWIYEENDMEITHSSNSTEWELPMHQKREIVKRLREYLQYSSVQLQLN